jgi:acetylglutamate/LysW-gamma-L-alpha-aminoadipate kinase
MKAEALLFFSNTPGLLRDVNDESSLAPRFEVAKLDEGLEMAQGRMKKKVLAAAEAVRGGIGRVIFADARVEQPITRALAGAGTVIA